MTKAAGFLHDQGRTVLFWGEYPLKVEDIPSLPSYLINAEVYGPEFDQAFRKRGIRQMIFTYTQADEQLFPNYYLLPGADQVNYAGTSQADEAHFRPPRDRIAQMYQRNFLLGSAPNCGLDGCGRLCLGRFGAAPGNVLAGVCHQRGMDLAPRFARARSRRRAASTGSITAASADSMDRIYQLMSLQAQFWESSWEWGPSAARSIFSGTPTPFFRGRRATR